MSTSQKKYELLKNIRDELISCKKCPLYKTRNLPMIGKGSHNAKIMFIGEAPGKQENNTGHPFCGKAGKILDEMLQTVGLTRDEIYITNILKCHPPSNRDPQESEIKACSDYLIRQIKIIQPQIICTLGRFAMKYIFSSFGLSSEIKSMSLCQGKIFTSGDKKIIPLYHPAAVLYDPNKKEEILEGIRLVI